MHNFLEKKNEENEKIIIENSTLKEELIEICEKNYELTNLIDNIQMQNSHINVNHIEENKFQELEKISENLEEIDD